MECQQGFERGSRWDVGLERHDGRSGAQQVQSFVLDGWVPQNTYRRQKPRGFKRGNVEKWLVKG